MTCDWGEAAALWAAFVELLKRALSFLFGAYWQKLRTELHQAQVNFAIVKANADEVRENHAEYTRLRLHGEPCFPFPQTDLNKPFKQSMGLVSHGGKSSRPSLCRHPKQA